MLPLLLACLVTVGFDSPPRGDAAVSECLARVKDINGAAGPRADAGYRIG